MKRKQNIIGHINLTQGYTSNNNPSHRGKSSSHLRTQSHLITSCITQVEKNLSGQIAITQSRSLSPKIHLERQYILLF